MKKCGSCIYFRQYVKTDMAGVCREMNKVVRKNMIACKLYWRKENENNSFKN